MGLSEPQIIDASAWPPMLCIEPDELQRVKAERDALAEQLEVLRAEIGRREEAAYRDGLGDRAAVLDQNRVLTATIAALVDRQHPLNLPNR